MTFGLCERDNGIRKNQSSLAKNILQATRHLSGKRGPEIKDYDENGTAVRAINKLLG
jgi:hypothetical protein